ncbi:MAG: hypothetical protein ACO1SV_17650 [Fimbriimonas sp.]
MPAAFAGTYSLVSVDWFPSSSPGIGTDGGSIYFGRIGYGENPLDIHYNLIKTISAPVGNFNNASAVPTVTGMWKWRVRWVGAVGELAPLTVHTTIHTKGSGSATSAADSYVNGVSGHGEAQVNDPNLGAFSCGSTATAPGVYMDSDSATAPDPSTFLTGGVTFAHVSGTTYEGYVTHSVQSMASLLANGSQTQIGTGKNGVPIYAYNSGGGASVNLSARIRLTHVDGVRLQPDL